MLTKSEKQTYECVCTYSLYNMLILNVYINDYSQYKSY